MTKIHQLLHKIPPFIFTTALFVTILLLTLIPHVGEGIPAFPHADKVVHFIMFGVFACVCWWDIALLKKTAPTWNQYFAIAIATSLFGGAIELLQGLPAINRSCDFNDFLSDAAGAWIMPLMFRHLIWKLLPTSCAVTLHTVTAPSSELEQVYTNSFPPEERRAWRDILEKAHLTDAPLQFTEIRHYGSPAGFISWWTFGSWCYVEHFAVDSRLRGAGIGSTALDKWLNGLKIPAVLEVELPESNPMARRRISFYERHGFIAHPQFKYIQPPYSPELPSVPLMLMTYGKITNLDKVAETIHTQVYEAF